MNHLDPMEAAVQLGLLVMEIHIGQKEYNEDTRMEMVRYAEIFLGLVETTEGEITEVTE